MNFDALSLLAQMLNAHGIPTFERDGWLIPKTGKTAWSVEFWKPDDVHPSIWRLDVSLALPDGRLLEESCAGAGTNAKTAASNAFNKFSQSAFHVLLSAFYEHYDNVQVHIEEWVDADSAWQAVVGPVLWVGDGPARGMPELLDIIKIAFFEQAPLVRPHWVRVYCSRLDNGPITLELLLDNVPWEKPRELVANLSWEPSNGFQSYRLFAVVVPKNCTRYAEFLPESDSVSLGFKRLLEIAETESNITDYSLFQALTSANVAPVIAEKLIAFVPIAFSEVFLKEANHSSEYQLLASGSNGPKLRLLDEPTYAIAKQFCPSVIKSQKVAFNNLALRSATVSAANQLLHNGRRLGNLHFTSPIVFLGRFSPQVKSNPLDQRTSHVKPAPRDKPSPKPWWRFW
jgi:hypothetical protein